MRVHIYAFFTWKLGFQLVWFDNLTRSDRLRVLNLYFFLIISFFYSRILEDDEEQELEIRMEVVELFLFYLFSMRVVENVRKLNLLHNLIYQYGNC